MDLYWNKGLSIRQVAKKLRVSDSTVHHRIAKFEIPKKSRMKYQKTPFSGDFIEMSYLLGVRAGDFSARKCYRQIRVWVTTTHPAMIKLFRDSFEEYTNVCKFPTYGNSRAKYKWRMYALVDRSFEFMVEKPELIPGETFRDDHGLLAFLAGYTDAEGSLIISRSRESIRYVYTISSEDYGLLNDFKDKLTKMGFHVSLRLVRKRGTEAWTKHKLRNDYWSLSLARKEEVLRLVQLLPLRHEEKLKKRELMLRFKNAKRWDEVKDEVLALRRKIREEVKRCILEAAREYNGRYPKTHSSHLRSHF